MKVVALAGGVGGAKLVDGLARVLPPQDLTVIVNSGDDFEHLGLKICPDLDTVCYTLAGLANPTIGWGREGETWNALESLAQLGGPDWFHVGDRDLGTHLERTRRLRAGQTLSQITRDFCRAWQIQPTILPMSDDPIPTEVFTQDGILSFQEYFVHQQCQPRVKGFRFAGVEKAQPAPGVLATLEAADLVVICPSNPWVSIDPILAVPGIRAAFNKDKTHSSGSPGSGSETRREGWFLAVSPIIGGQTVKGPAAKMYAELGFQPSALAVARHYGSFLDFFVMDRVDSDQAEAVAGLNVQVHVTDTIMKTAGDRLRLAEELLTFAENQMS